MDRNEFDGLTRALASGVSRRKAFRALFGGAVGGAAAITGLTAVTAKDDRDDDKKHKSDCCPKSRPDLCDFTCIDRSDDPNNCGKCGKVCASGRCVKGVCKATSPTDTATSSPTQTSTATPTSSLTNTSTPSPTSTSTNTPANTPTPTCLNAGALCTVGAGACQRTGAVVCQSDGSSRCSATPGSPQAEICNGIDDDCDGVIDNGAECPSRTNSVSQCTAGSCVYVCHSGFADCNADPTDGCEIDVRTSVANCGACGVSCPSTPNGTATCVNGTCGFACNPGYTKLGATCVPSSPAVVGLSVPDVRVNQSVSGTVTLSSPAPSPTTVILTHELPDGAPGGYVSPPAVTVPTGGISAQFGVSGIAAGEGKLTARLGINQVSDTFQILPTEG